MALFRNRRVLDRASDISTDAAQVFFAVMVVPTFIGIQDSRFAVFGGVAATVLWILSLWIAKIEA